MEQSGWLLDVKGKSGKTYGFVVTLDPEYIDEWLADGIQIVGRIENTIPMWLPACLIRPWCFCQSIFNFRNPIK